MSLSNNSNRPRELAGALFISHSTADRYFVNLLVEVLDYHYVTAWCSLTNLQPGTPFRTEIDDAITRSSALVVVVSHHATRSHWITKEVATFQAKNPTGLVIPLLLDETDPDTIIDGLSNHQAIPFFVCMRSGFQLLLHTFGKDFLKREDRRKLDRRESSDRRADTDRRVSPLIVRLRKGFWKRYAAARSMGEFDEMSMMRLEFTKTLDALAEEAAKYTYEDSSGHKVDPLFALEKSMDIVWQQYRDREHPKAVYVIEAIAEHVYATYKVQSVESRRIEGRRTRVNRRDQLESN